MENSDGRDHQIIFGMSSALMVMVMVMKAGW